ncbi:FMN-binding protein [Ferrimonas lipolytica]|uniref:FMN-binding protein n=1 Tax=Ferrimonas lipolytica TaxID=2724191 RepID=A0A6H1UBS4_9GAMM|nr:FMN-binding protein [Ferrimonas lipolytica]QIZ76288.1 FMN-binding protein [Ferrimonas lipolytica]
MQAEAIAKSAVEKSKSTEPTPQRCSRMSGCQPANKPRVSNKKRKERHLAALTIVLLIAVWILGLYRESTDIEPYLYQTMPQAQRLEATANGNFAGYRGEQLLGYVTIGQGSGYGGPMHLAVAINLEGSVTGIEVVRHLETPAWFERVNRNALVSRLFDKSYADPFALGNDVDGLAGATYTSRGLADAVADASRRIAAQELQFRVAPTPAATVEFGLPELTLLALFALGIIGRRRSFRHTKKMRWLCMLSGMVMLGFVYTNPLTISMLNKMLLGFWPDWHTHLYWYMLLGGVIFSLTAVNKNPYCEWICPFGAAQECMGKVGGAKAHNARRFQTQLMWLQRSLALFAVIVALLYRNPGLSSYEVFGTLFDLEGNVPQFMLLGLVLLVAMFVHRPWCRYLCPIKPIEAFIKVIRSWTKELWQNLSLKRKA